MQLLCFALSQSLTVHVHAITQYRDGALLVYYPSPLKCIEIELSCLSGKRRLCPCITFKDSLSYLGGSVGRASVEKRSCL